MQRTKLDINAPPDFTPIAQLWEGDAAPYPSEQSARWNVRQMRAELLAAGAIAVCRGRVMIHLGKFAEVAQQRAIDAARRRYGAACESISTVG